MKKIISAAVIWVFLLAVPFVIVSCRKNEIPQNSQVSQIPQTQEQPVSPPRPQPKPVNPIPSSSFMKGYWDGWHGMWLGPIRWTLSDDYRQGHMLGSYDRKHNIERYTPDQR